MNRTAFSLPEHSEYRTRGGLVVSRAVEQFTGNAKRLDDLIDLLDRRPGVVLSSGTTVPGRYESFDFGFADPPLVLETTGANFSLAALNVRGEGPRASTPKRRDRDLPIPRPANIRPPSSLPAPRSRAAICSRRCLGNCSPNPVSDRRRKFSSGCAVSTRRPMAR